MGSENDFCCTGAIEPPAMHPRNSRSRRAGIDVAPLTPESRKALPRQERRYWWRIAYGLSLGYKVGQNGASWQVRGRVEGGTYRFAILGRADDDEPANGSDCFSFDQARIAACVWYRSIAGHLVDPMVRRLALPEVPKAGDYTVAHALVEYMAWYVKNRRSAPSVFHALKTHVLPHLGNVPVALLTTAQISDWFEAMTEAPRRMRTARGTPIRFYPPPRSPEEIRKRKNYANRLLVFLQAALNRSFYTGKVNSDLAWRRVRKHRNVDKPRTRYLTRLECSGLLGSCAPDLRRLVTGALLTGCRSAELRTLRVADFIQASGKILLEETKSGRPRAVCLTQDGQRFFAELASGRAASEFMFLREDGRPWGSEAYRKSFAKASDGAGISPPVTFHVLRHTYATHAVLAGIPLVVVAQQLGHTTTIMVQRHYLHLAQDYIDLQVRRLMPNLCFGDANA